MPRSKTFIWVRWLSHRNGNDGRRDSAIGVNKSKWHFPYPQFGEFMVACGREIGPFETRSKSEDEVLLADTCKVCLNRAFKGIAIAQI